MVNVYKNIKAAIITSSSDAVGGSVTAYATAAVLPLSGNTTGDQAYVSETGRLYIWTGTGTGWYNIALINTNPVITSAADASYALSIDGTPTIVTLVANDPEDVPITWSYAVTSGSLSNGGGNTATVTQTDNVFTITPSVNQAHEGGFGITFTASDGVNLATSASTFILSFNISSFEYLVVAGGGGGSMTAGGGGGGGGYIASSTAVALGNTYSIVIGAGGLGAIGDGGNGLNGANSTLSGPSLSVTTIGGGGGNHVGVNTFGGGSGGGGGYGSLAAGGTATAGQGNNGGRGGNITNPAGAVYPCGGGGGAGAVGGDVGSGNYSGGIGGAGLQWLNGSYYAGGGGGSGNEGGAAGIGGGGIGGRVWGDTKEPGIDGTGGGGGGGGGGNLVMPGLEKKRGDGGSGVVIIRYSSAFPDASSATQTQGAPSLTVASGYKYYTFTQSGSITF